MIIEYDGKEYPYDSDDLDVDQALAIEKHTGGPLLEWQKGLITADVKSTQALGWLVLHGGDAAVPIASVNFKFSKFRNAFDAAYEKQAAEEKAAKEAEEAADPTAAANGRSPLSIPVSSPSA